jgi:hypothetical protein
VVERRDRCHPDAPVVLERLLPPPSAAEILKQSFSDAGVSVTRHE